MVSAARTTSSPTTAAQRSYAVLACAYFCCTSPGSRRRRPGRLREIAHLHRLFGLRYHGQEQALLGQ